MTDLVLRVNSEINFYKESVLLDVAADKAQARTVSGLSSSTNVDDQRTVDDHKKKVEKYASDVRTWVKVRSIADLNLTTFAVVFGMALAGGEINRLSVSFRQNPELAAGKILDKDGNINLLACDEIPFCLHEDSLFSSYICPITTSPIRYVVADPTTTPATLYEKRELIEWLKKSPRSPTSKKDLTPEMLHARPAVQALIDNRLDSYSQKINEEIKKNLILKIENSNLTVAALTEQPNIDLPVE